jgi:endonuclease/exonuclease/phosphatase family metal-dependent hydrolase
LKVVTINILSDLTRWKQRRPLLVAGLADLQPDLIALQEASIPANTALWLAGKLEMPHIHLSPKTGKRARREGIAILSRLPFEEQATLDLQTQNRVAQYVRVRADQQTLIFANGHFFWEPGDSSERQRQVERFVEWLNAIPGDPPMVVCGDFNATPETGAIQFMRRQFVSAYAAVHGQEPEYTSPTPLPRSKLGLLGTLFEYRGEISLRDFRLNWRGTLDYIFVDRHVRVLDCQVVLNQPSPLEPKIYPSDHFGLAADIEVNHE